MKNICETCVRWVDCGNKGYCVLEPLYTYTEKESCPDYVQGEPLKEAELVNECMKRMKRDK